MDFFLYLLSLLTLPPLFPLLHVPSTSRSPPFSAQKPAGDWRALDIQRHRIHSPSFQPHFRALALVSFGHLSPFPALDLSSLFSSSPLPSPNRLFMLWKMETVDPAVLFSLSLFLSFFPDVSLLPRAARRFLSAFCVCARARVPQLTSHIMKRTRGYLAVRWGAEKMTAACDRRGKRRWRGEAKKSEKKTECRRRPEAFSATGL